MSRFSAFLATATLSTLLFAVAVPAETNTSEASSPGTVSKVRIVRLSEVRGAVELDRNNGRGFEPAMANLPVVEKNRLKTAVGAAEVEFEDNSTLRLAPDSEIEFPELGRTAAGSTVSAVRVLKGMAYVSLVKAGKKAQPDEFDLLFGDQKVQLQPAAHIRLVLNDKEAKLAVLDGALHIDGPNGALDVQRKKTLEFPMTGSSEPSVTKNVAENPFDGWDKKATEYHARVASMTAFGGSPYSYGVNDVMYYGSFADVGGCGMMWRPYFASAAWDPYSNGAWAYYSGAGYSWVSPYPWGWTPYHYGSWNYCPGAGWGWQPGGNWMGLNNGGYVAAAMVNNRVQTGSGVIHRSPPPSHPPTTGQATLLYVNQRPLIHSNADSPESFVFRRDSAGMGIPREGLGNLRSFSQHAIQRGSASTPIYLSVAPSNGARPMGTPVAPVSIHRGSAPDRTSMGIPVNSAANPGGGRSMGAPGPSSSGSMSSGMGHASSPGPAPAPSSGSHR